MKSPSQFWTSFGMSTTTGPGRPVRASSKCAAHRIFEQGRIRDEEYVFRNGAHDRRDRRFLESVGADGRRGNLPANHDQWHGVRHAVSNRRNGVRGAGPGGDHHHADLAAGPGIAGRHEAGPLFVGGDHQRHGRAAVWAFMSIVVAKHRVINRQDGAAAVAEDRFDALIGQDLHNRIRAAQLPPGERVLASRSRVCLIAHLPAVRACKLWIFRECLLIFVALQYWRLCATIRA